MTAERTPYHVDFEPINECPVSYISSDPEVLEIMATMNRAHLAYKASGASLFGPDFSQWPPWAAEALVIIEQERCLVDAAEMDAMRQDARVRERRNRSK